MKKKRRDIQITLVVHDSMLNEETKKQYIDWTGEAEKDSFLVDSSQHNFRMEEITIDSPNNDLSLMMSHGPENEGVFISVSIPISVILALMIQNKLSEELLKNMSYFYNEGKELLKILRKKEVKINRKKSK